MDRQDARLVIETGYHCRLCYKWIGMVGNVRLNHVVGCTIKDNANGEYLRFIEAWNVLSGGN